MYHMCICIVSPVPEFLKITISLQDDILYTYMDSLIERRLIYIPFKSLGLKTPVLRMKIISPLKPFLFL